MTARRAGAIAGGIGLMLVSVLYCLPMHPSSHRSGLDVASHVLLFALIAGLGWLVARRAWMFTVVAALGVVLEVVQWRVGGYPRVEMADILANEGGVVLAGVVYALRNRKRA